MPRELIDTTREKRFVRRSEGGRFDKVVNVGKSLASDTRRKAKTTVAAGDGDRGDQKTAARATSRSARSAASKRTLRSGPSRQTKSTATESRRRTQSSTRTGRR